MLCSRRIWSRCIYGYKYTSVENPILDNSFETSEHISSLSDEGIKTKIVTCGLDLYVVGKIEQTCSFENLKFSDYTKKRNSFPSLLD